RVPFQIVNIRTQVVFFVVGENAVNGVADADVVIETRRVDITILIVRLPDAVAGGVERIAEVRIVAHRRQLREDSIFDNLINRVDSGYQTQNVDRPSDITIVVVGEDAVARALRQDRAIAQGLRALAQSFVREEKEGPVFDDRRTALAETRNRHWPADFSAEVVTVEERDVQSRAIAEEVVRGQLRVAIELEERAVKFAFSARRNQTNLRAAILVRAGVLRHHREFARVIHRRAAWREVGGVRANKAILNVQAVARNVGE